MVLDYREYALFDYEHTTSKTDKFRLGDVVLKDNTEIGVIIQVHGNEEYRTDMFGNCCESEIRLATNEEIKTFREELISNCI